MGTGGSLRLLSPEIGQGPNPFAAAFLPPSDRPYNGLPTSSERLRFGLRTLKTAQVGFTSAVRPRQLPFTLTFSHKLSSRFRDSFPAPRFALASPVPCSLIPVPSFQDQALDRLVSSSSIRYSTSTDDLSTLSSSRGLTCFKQWQFYSLGGLHA